MFQLEKYKGSKNRYTCPACGHKNVFARYVNELGEYVDDSCGRCNRESRCGYHSTPKDYLTCNNVTGVTAVTSVRSATSVTHVTSVTPVTQSYFQNDYKTIESFETIDNSFLIRSLEHTSENRLINYLLSFIDVELVERAVKSYFVGSTKEGKTVFWMIDRKERARTGKIISYVEETGKRDKQVNPSWIHYELKKHKLLSQTFEHKLCYFGEHLIDVSNKPIALCEAEKTAFIASIFLDQFTWLAVGAKSWLKADKLRMFGKRKVILYPDADAFDLWSREAEDAQKIGLNVEISDFIESRATPDDRENGYDLADYLINWELYAQSENEKIDTYNNLVDLIIADKNLFKKFNDKWDATFPDGRIPLPEQIREIARSVQ